MGCTLTPIPLYPRVCLFVGGREGPRQRLEQERHRRGKVSLLPSNHCLTLHCSSLAAYLYPTLAHILRDRGLYSQ